MKIEHKSLEEEKASFNHPSFIQFMKSANDEKNK